MPGNILKTTMRWLMAAGLMGANVFADDAPGRGVARLSLLQGDVSVRRGDSGEWVAAAPNAPLVVGDRVLTGISSQAEVQLDYANIVRLAPNSELRLAELEYRRYILQLAAGTVMFTVLRDSEADVEVSTPSVAVRPVKRGMYRVTVLPDGSSEVTVRSGEVDIYTTQGSERLKSGRTLLARGTSTQVEYQVNAAIPRDEFDQWNERRNQDLSRSTSYRYVDPSIYGAEDLDSYGNWVQDPPYGWVWVPRVAVGWSPYYHGRWSWVDWYGWSWVSYDPWGWAPYHYGRWYWGSRGWCWWPGAYRTRHYWSPGLVAWVGFGHGVSVGVGFGRVGWVPLAPYETYHPWYGWNRYRGFGNRTYVDNSVTIVNNYNIRNNYRNARVTNGVHAVDSGDFARGRFNNIVRMRDNDLHQASLVRGELPVAPERSSLRLADRDVRGTPHSREVSNFVSRRSPGRTERVSFEDQQRGVSELSRRTFGDRTIRAEQTTAGGSPAPVNVEGNRRSEGFRQSREPAAVPGGGSGSSGESRGWRRLGEASPTDSGRDSGSSRRFGEPRSTDRGVAVETRSQEPSGLRSRENTDRGGWRRFGEPSSGGVSRSEPSQPSTVRSRDNGAGWRRFEGSGSSGSSGSPGRFERRSESPPTPREAPQGPSRMERPQREPSASPPRDSGMERRRSNDRSSGEPVRMSPPIVRERTRSSEARPQEAPRFEGRSSRSGSFGGFGGSSRQGGSMDSGRSRGGSFGGSGGGIGRSSSGGGMRSGGGGGGTSGGGGGGSRSGGGGGRGRGR